MYLCPDLWLLIIEQMQARERARSEQERLARMLRQANRRQRLVRFYCAMARRMIAHGTMILNKYDDEAVNLRRRRV